MKWLFLILILLAACGRRDADPRLGVLEREIGVSASAALDSLNRIDRHELSKSDRKYQDLLMVKATYAAGLHYESDSMARVVADYYSDASDPLRRVEAYFYCGHVYEDVGKYAKAFECYRKVVDASVEFSYDFHVEEMRRIALSRIGHILLAVGSEGEAEKYFLKAIEKWGDDERRKADWIGLGDVYASRKDFHRADSCYGVAAGIGATYGDTIPSLTRKSGMRIPKSSDGEVLTNDEYRRILNDLAHERSEIETSIRMGDKERHHTQEQDTMMVIILMLVAVGIVVGTVGSVIMVGKARAESRLRKALDSIREMEKALDEAYASKSREESGEMRVELREVVRNQILALESDVIAEVPVAREIMESAVYGRLMSLLGEERIVPEMSELWKELEDVVSSASEKFMESVMLLSGGMNDEEMHLALLIKSGFTPTQSANLVGRSKSTMSYRRKALCKRLFGDEIDVKKMDAIIRML